jgi:uncharacterized phage protein gp47/JayE
MSTTTYPLATLACTLNSAGITAPAYSDILNSLIATYQGIYGSDIDLSTGSKLYQELAARAAAQNDTNQATIAAYNSFAPDYAQGTGLSRLVKINAIQREVPSNSTVTLTLIGQAGTIVSNAIAQDANGNLWDIPITTIPNSGSILVTATCETQGAITAAENTITTIYTPQFGLQSVNNAAPAVPGAPVELDAALRQRQAVSTANSAKTPSQTILGNVANVPGVSRSAIYVNNTPVTDSNGVPASAVSLIVQGGSISAIAQAIEQTKAPGIPTYGNTSVVVQDPAGLPVTINFNQLVDVPIYVAITINPLSGYTSVIGSKIVNAVANFINSLNIGVNVRYSWIEGAAGLIGTSDGLTFEITALTIGTSLSAMGTADIAIAYNQSASTLVAYISLAT